MIESFLLALTLAGSGVPPETTVNAGGLPQFAEVAVSVEPSWDGGDRAGGSQDRSGDDPAGHRRVVSVNPVALVALGLFSMDYEQRLGQDTTWGVSLSYFDWRDRNYLSLDGKLRYYFGGEGLEGLSVGFILGMNRAGRDEDEVDERSRRSGAAVGLGFVAEQQWLVGSGERFAVTLGAGGKRLFFLRDVGAQRALPTVRLSIGWAF